MSQTSIPAFLCSALVVVASWAGSADASPRATDQQRDRMAPLLEAMWMPDVFDIIHDEGVGHAEELRAEMFPERGGARWTDVVRRIYDRDAMAETMLDEMAAETTSEHVAGLLEFFTSDLGGRIVEAEIAARRAMLDPSVEEASRAYVETLRVENEDRFSLLTAFVEENDLVDLNVVGALNSNYEFYSGLNAAGAFDPPRSESDILREVWLSEADVRDETESWVMAYSALAYQPLTSDELAAYLAFSEAATGRAFNANLFSAFDAIFRRISFDLGMAAAQFMAGEDL